MTKLKDILKKDGIIKITPDESLGTALSRLRTSHDAAFVFDNQQKFLGLINPYYTLIKSSYPGNAKVEHCLYHPPKIRIDFSVSKVADLFIQTKVHYLPVFDHNDNFVGIVSARHLLSEYVGYDLFDFKIRELLTKKNKPIFTVYEDDNISDAISTFKREKISKLIVINRDLKLRGILSYYDLISYLISPKDSQHRGERIGSHIGFYHCKVKNFAKSYALTLNLDESANEALKLILDKKIGSVIVVDQERHPIGIITTKDFLCFLTKRENRKMIELISINLSKQSRQILGGFFHHFNTMLRSFPDLAKAKLLVKEKKQGNFFEAVLSLIPKKGPSKIIRRGGRDIFEVLFPFNMVIRRLRKS